MRNGEETQGRGTLLAAALNAALLGWMGEAMALDKVTLGTNWKAQAEHGGYYQAVTDGIYERYGLEVTIRPGGPQVNPGLFSSLTWEDHRRGGGRG
jgi:NitT/TauT family transport system substrate-binding protein